MRHISEDPNISKRQIINLIIFLLLFSVGLLVLISYVVIVHTVYDLLMIILISLLATLPATIANIGMTLTAVALSKLGSNHPVDGGKSINGKRILGDGKSWEGLIGGSIFAFLVCVLISKSYGSLWNLAEGMISIEFVKIETIAMILGQNIEPAIFYLGLFLLSIGGPIGDMVGSSIKRRFDKPRGSQFFVLDQLDFIMIAILIAYPIFSLPLIYIVFVFFFTPLFHVLFNVIGYYTGTKREPW